MKLSCCLALACVLPVWADLITNGGFESGFSSWTRVDQIGSEGTFASQTGTTSSVNDFTVPAPPEGTTAAMTDSEGPGSHLLYQDFLVPTIVTGMSIRFSLYINNHNTEDPAFFKPEHLDFATPVLNQQARVDIITTTVDPFTAAPADILQNLYQTDPDDPRVSGYTPFLFNITPLLQAHEGQTLRLRFANVDNVAPFNFGVDNVSIDTGVIPEPSTWLLACSALLAVGLAGQRAARRTRAIKSPAPRAG
jgi:hypothetical protein